MINKVIVLCNNRIAIPALQQLFVSGALLAVGVPETNPSIQTDLQQLFKEYAVPIIVLEKEKFSIQLSEMNKIYLNDYFLLMTFPWKIPLVTINKFKSKLFNFHYGILPEVRGVDPIFEAIRNQHQETGISVHEVTENLDAGSLLLIQKTPIHPNTTHGMLCSQLGQVGAHIANWFIMQNKQTLVVQNQDESKAVYYNRPGQKEVLINWKNQDSSSIKSLVNACNPWNKGAYTNYNGWMFRITDCSCIKLEDKLDNAPGTIVTASETTGILVACNDNNLLKIDFFYTEEGFFKGTQLIAFGLKAGDQFT